MTSECTFYIDVGQDILQLHGMLKQHVVVYSPPYSILTVMSPFMRSAGRQIKVVIHHASRDVQIVEGSVSQHVLRTAVRAFQTHRLSAVPPVQPEPRLRPVGEATQQDCTICFESIGANDGLALPCMHAFHPQCIRPWLFEHRTCPVCRHPV